MKTILEHATEILLFTLCLWFIYRVIRAAIRSPKEALAVIVVLICIVTLLCMYVEKNRHLKFMPEAFKVEKVLYAKEDSWGFGPGGAETGIIVYELPDTAAKKITQGELSYLSTLYDKGKYPDMSNWYQGWKETPIAFNDQWASPDSSERDGLDFVPKIKTYLFRYAYFIEVAPGIESFVDKVISEKGSYYAYGRYGLIIVSPKTHRVVFAYRG